MDPLHASLQDITTLLSPSYWTRCVPWLTCSRDTDGENDHFSPEIKSSSMNVSPLSIKDESLRLLRANALLTRGFLTLDVSELPNVPIGIVERLHRGVLRLIELGHTASSISSFDEAWTLASAISPTVSSISSGRLMHSGDYFSFAKCSSRLGGFNGPHRDKPNSGVESFSTLDGSADYVTVWIALSEATPENSCLYFLPRDTPDEGYLKKGDSMTSLDLKNFDAICAQPCSAGSAVVFTHRVIHWGSRPQECQETRVAMSFAMASPLFEKGPFFSEKYLPFPPLPLRVALRAGQAVAYAFQNPLTKSELALNTRIFSSNKKYFSETYSERISSDAQWQKFMRK
jgi:hypothetical protein